LFKEDRIYTAFAIPCMIACIGIIEKLRVSYNAELSNKINVTLYGYTICDLTPEKHLS